MEVYETLQLAATDAQEAYESNKDKLPHMRMSRAGLPLLQLVMEDFIIPKLPKVETNERKGSGLKRTMAIGTGFLYEKAIYTELLNEFTGVSILSQEKLELEGITGTLDYLVLDEVNKWAVVVECKALDVESLKQGRDQKLLVDNWGYKTQMCLYLAAVQRKYPEFKVFPQWRLWAKKISKSFIYKPVFDNFQETCVKALDRAFAYNTFAKYWQAQDADSCLDILMTFEDPMPEKQPFYGGYSASCGFHFSPWSAAILDNDGFLLPNAEENLKLLLQVTFGQKSAKMAISLLDTNEHIAV